MVSRPESNVCTMRCESCSLSGDSRLQYLSQQYPPPLLSVQTGSLTFPQDASPSSRWATTCWWSPSSWIRRIPTRCRTYRVGCPAVPRLASHSCLARRTPGKDEHCAHARRERAGCWAAGEAYSNHTNTTNPHRGLINAPPYLFLFLQTTFFTIHLQSKRPDIY